MKNLFKSASCGDPAKFVWQRVGPKSTKEWDEAVAATTEADEAHKEAIAATMKMYRKRTVEVKEHLEAIATTIYEGAEKLDQAIQNKVDAAKTNMWNFTVKIHGKVKAETEDVKTAYDAAVDKVDEVAEDAYNSTKEGVTDAAQTAGDFGRGRDIRLAQNAQQNKEENAEDVEYANENIFDIPENLKNIGNSATEMGNNISGAERQEAFRNYFPEGDFSKFKYKAGLSAKGNQMLFNYLDKHK